MKREWQPGDVAMIGSCPALRVDNQGDTYFIDSAGLHWRREDENARPLVVIDPEDREQVERLVRWYYERFAQIPGASVSIEGGEIDAMQAALREFANPTPPKPDEPTGLGAVVEDATGMRWVRVKSITTVRHWRHEHGGDRKRYDDINAVKVLSEGVTNDA